MRAGELHVSNSTKTAASTTPKKSLMSGKVGIAGAPPGPHVARFLDCEEVEPNERAIAEDWAPSMKLIWQIDGLGVQASRIVPQKPTSSNIAGKLVGALLDRPLGVNEDYDLTPCVGKEYNIVVEEATSGKGTRVTSCFLKK
jgi:hypothetical protein